MTIKPDTSYVTKNILLTTDRMKRILMSRIKNLVECEKMILIIVYYYTDIKYFFKGMQGFAGSEGLPGTKGQKGEGGPPGPWGPKGRKIFLKLTHIIYNV